MTVASFFSGCGGLDLGFKQAGFKILWANEYDKTIHDTFLYNHPETYLCKKNIYDVDIDMIPEVDGFIGGPPCQSWSVGGKNLGIEDDRGKLLLHYIHIITLKKPKFFLIENVFGILTQKHFPIFKEFINKLGSAGYDVTYAQLNAKNYKVPQDRNRVFVVGTLKELNINFVFPSGLNTIISLQKAIGDLKNIPSFYTDRQIVKPNEIIPNHDVYIGNFDQKYMARNRVRSWEEVSFTIQAQAKNCPLHPQAPKMRYIDSQKRIFEPGYEHLYRRLSVRECARIQTFPDNFIFLYQNIKTGYKMVGNAVPPRLAKYIALGIKAAFEDRFSLPNVLVAYYKSNQQLELCKERNMFYIRADIPKEPLSESMTLPTFLLLVKGKKRKLFKIKANSNPIFTEREILIAQGFQPKHLFYWVIPIEGNSVVDYPTYVPKWTGPRNRKAYLDNINIEK